MLPVSQQHYLTITDRDGKQIRGKVVYIQAKKERWRVDHAEVHITTSDWLDPYRTPATYSTATQSVDGYYLPLSYEMLDEKRSWLFKGTFERAEAK